MWESKTRWYRSGGPHDQDLILFVHGVTYKDLSELEKQIKYLSPCCVQQRVFGTLCSVFELNILHLLFFQLRRCLQFSAMRMKTQDQDLRLCLARTDIQWADSYRRRVPTHLCQHVCVHSRNFTLSHVQVTIFTYFLILSWKNSSALFLGRSNSLNTSLLKFY